MSGVTSNPAVDISAWCYATGATLWFAVGDGEPNNFGDTRGSGVAGPLAGLIIALLALGTVLLIRNMNKRLRRLPPSFDTDRGVRHDAIRHDSVAPVSPAVEPKQGD